MTDLADRLRAALDAHEKAAKFATHYSREIRESGRIESWETVRAGEAGEVLRIQSRYGELRPHRVIDLDPLDRLVAEHVVLNDPAHVLRTIAAHREIVERHRPDLERPSPLGTLCHYCSPGEAQAEYPCADLRDIASIYLPDTDRGEPR